VTGRIQFSRRMQPGIKVREPNDANRTPGKKDETTNQKYYDDDIH
jgi:hypothetical protein